MPAHPDHDEVTGRALVTGTSSGIGAAIAARLLSTGWQVTGVSRRPADIDHPNFTWHSADVTQPDELETLRAQRFDAVVHAAGLLRSAPLGKLTAADADQMWRVHVQAAETLANILVDEMPDGARIVLIGSRTMTGTAGKSQYTATKAAMLAMARSWAAELAPRRITVNVVAPGPTATPMLADPGRSHTPPRKPPLGELVQPDEVASLVTYLLGPNARNITGQALIIDGGASLT